MSRTVRVLVVDDEESIRETLSEFLLDEGYDVEVAADAASAKVKLGEQPFDIVLSDVIMPRESGIDLMHFVRDHAARTKVILITGEPTFESAAEAVRSGAFDYLSKPVNQASVTRTVAAAARVVTLERENRDWRDRLEQLVAERTAQLRDSEARYREVVERTPMGIFAHQAGRVTYANPRMAEILGYSHDELPTVLGRPFVDFVHPDDAPAMLARIADRLADRPTPDVSEARLLHRDGHVVWVELRVTALRREGDPVFMGNAIDVTDRRLARDEQRRLVSVIENSREFIGIASADGRVSYVNEAGLRLVGLSSLEEARERTIFDFVSEEERPNLSGAIMAEVRAHGVASGDGTMRHFVTGQDFDVQFTTFLLPSPEGQAPPDMAVVMSDVSQRKAAERALKESEARYRLLTERQRDVVASVDLDGTLLYCSPAVRVFGGYEPDEEVGENIEKYVHPDDWPATATEMAMMILERRDGTAEFRYVARDGSVFPVEVSGSPVIEGDEVQSIQCIIRDVRDRKRAEAEQRDHLRRVERQQEALAALASDAAFVRGDFDATASDLAGRAARALGVDMVEVWTESADRVSACQTAVFDAVAGRLTADVRYPLEAFESVRAILESERALAVRDIGDDRRVPPIVVEHAAQRGLTAGLYVPIRVRGHISGVVTITVRGTHREWHPDEVTFAAALGDHLAQAMLIAERVHAEEEKERLRERLLQAQRLEAVGRLAGGVAHDFNNILTSIGGYADLLHERLDQRDPLRADVDEIRTATDRAAWLTSQLLAFSRRQVVTPRVIHVDEVVDQARRMLARIIGDDVRLEFRPGADVWPIKMDPGQVDQILVNLATNARDAMPTGGVLTLETANVVVGADDDSRSADARPGEYVRVRVHDDGSGMDEATLPYVFEPFFSTKDVGKGTGLGLATVYGIVKQNGGFIEVRSRAGAGTTFDVHLPRTAEASAEVDAVETPGAPPRGVERVLVVEDDDTIRRLVRRILARKGYEVVEARDGLDARRRFADDTERIDLVLSDVVMPNMDGRQLLVGLRESRPRLPALFMSGHAEDIVSHRAILDDRTGFIQKPFASADLLRRVRDLLDRA